jgi:tetratricopeptide (TPR) repeat protein
MQKQTDNLSAYEAFLKGMHLFSIENKAALEESLDCFRRATELDPRYGRAWAALGYGLMQAWRHGWRDDDAKDEAMALALRAVEFSKDDYFAQGVLGFCQYAAGRFDDAVARYDGALALNPNDADLLVDASEALIAVGRFREAIEHIEKAMLLNPHVPDWYRVFLAWAYFLLGDCRRSLTEIEKIERIHPHTLRLKALDLLCLGDDANAKKVASEFSRYEPAWTLDLERRHMPMKEEAFRGSYAQQLQRLGILS